jgi:hypothetical protein
VTLKTKKDSTISPDARIHAFAEKGIHTSDDLTEFLGALADDVLHGKISTRTAPALNKEIGKRIKEMGGRLQAVARAYALLSQIRKENIKW